MLEEKAPDVIEYIAAGLCGSGSECFGLDDEISQDHDFEPGFCIFIPDENIVGRKAEFELERAYSYLPREFMGFRRSPLNPAGGNRHGVIRISDFFSSRTGYPGIIPSEEAWFGIPDSYIAEAVNGEIFEDNFGLMTEIRTSLSKMPSDVFKKKIAGRLILMYQAGEYNYNRCILRGDPGGAQLSAHEFVRHAISCIYLINGSFCPYYKLAFKGLRKLPSLSDTYESLLYLISSGNGPEEAQNKSRIIASVSDSVLRELAPVLKLGSADSLEKAAFEINDSINSITVRSSGILSAVD